MNHSLVPTRRINPEESISSAQDKEALATLDRMHMLQRMRKSLADVDVALAKRLLALAETSLQNAREALLTQTREVSARREYLTQFYTTQTTSVNRIFHWQEEVGELIASISSRTEALKYQEAQVATATRELEEKIARRRAIQIRQEKFSSMRESLEEL